MDFVASIRDKEKEPERPIYGKKQIKDSISEPQGFQIYFLILFYLLSCRRGVTSLIALFMVVTIFNSSAVSCLGR